MRAVRQNLERGTAPLVSILIIAVAAILFYGWGLLLLIRFALAFRKAARQMRRDWQRDDRAA